MEIAKLKGLLIDEGLPLLDGSEVGEAISEFWGVVFELEPGPGGHEAEGRVLVLEPDFWNAVDYVCGILRGRIAHWQHDAAAGRSASYIVARRWVDGQGGL